RDSKRLSARQRLTLNQRIVDSALAFGIGEASVEEIDRLNILQATFLAMQRAVRECLNSLSGIDDTRKGMSIKPIGLNTDSFELLVDGHLNPQRWLGEGWPWRTQTVIRGDSLIAEISAASIIAKVHRDQQMQAFAKDFPGYGFESNAGYGTAAHLEALRNLGPCSLHRRSFAPVSAHIHSQT
ncbi:MAG: Ribonuclease, partial [Pseudomonadota bacterium]